MSAFADQWAPEGTMTLLGATGNTGSAGFAAVLAALDTLVRDGTQAVVGDTVERLTGTPPRSFAEPLKAATPGWDTGSLAGDVRALLENVVTWLADDRGRRVYPDLIAEAQRNPKLGKALTAYVGRPRRARAIEVLERAAERGDVVVGADQEVVVDALGALVFWRLIALGQPVTAAHLDRVAVAICAMARGNNPG